MSYSEKKLKQLLIQVTNGNVDAFNELYYEFSSFVYNTAISVSCNADKANDIVQEVYIKLYQLSHSHIPHTNAISWLYKVTKNEAYSHLRKEKPTQTIEDMDNQLTAPSFEDNLLSDLLFQECLSALQESEREILILKLMGGLKHKTIANILDAPEGTIRWRYREALKHLKNIYKEKGYHHE